MEQGLFAVCRGDVMQGQTVTCRGKAYLFAACNIHGEVDAGAMWSSDFRGVQGRSQAGPSVVCRGTAQQGLLASCRGAAGQGLVNNILFLCRCVPNKAVLHRSVLILLKVLLASCTTDTCREAGMYIQFTNRWLTYFIQPSIMKAMRNK